MNSGTFILVGALVATGAIVYHGTMAGASQRPLEPTATATSTELARSQTHSATPDSRATATPPLAAAATPALRITLDQVRRLPRPVAPPASVGYLPPTYPVATSTPSPTASPEPPSEVPSTPGTPTATPTLAIPMPTATPEPWNIPTPPPLPSPPDNWMVPQPPTE